jgi:cytochrome c oxidase cbb3-type subunit III
MSRHPMLRLLPSLLVVLASIGAATSFSAGITGPSKGDPAAGKKIFKDKCVACHKPDGSGGVKVTGNPTPDFRDAKRMNDPKYNDDYLRDCITNGKTKSGMVAWSKQGVKPAQIENLIAYIRTFSAEKKAAEPEKK